MNETLLLLGMTCIRVKLIISRHQIASRLVGKVGGERGVFSSLFSQLDPMDKNKVIAKYKHS